jgi:hypothetical protein
MYWKIRPYERHNAYLAEPDDKPIEMSMFAFTIPTTLPGLLVLAVGLLILWIVVSIPVYISGELITGGKTDFGSAMGATLGGAVMYVLILWLGTFFLTPILGSAALAISFVLALFIWVAVYGAAFDAGWLGALAIVIMSWIVLVVLDVILTSLFGVSFPKFYPF